MRRNRDAARSPRRERDIDAFDRRAARYEHDRRSQFHAIVVARSVEIALSAFADPVAVLDVGCGTGAAPDARRATAR
jgi:hypothetical protein